jgi:N-acetyl-anhydromuramyl-L-alanine amidase AmpD
MKIDRKKYTATSDGYYRRKQEKTQIILAGSLRKENFHIKRWASKKIDETKTWAHFTIDRSGNIYQHFDHRYYSDFMGDKDVDRKSISIVLENMGYLYYDNETEKYLNWLNEECPEELVFEKKWNGYVYWEKYTKEQMKSCIDLCKYLCEEEIIEVESIGHNVYYGNSEQFEGILTRSNYNSDYTDLNPSFDFKLFLNEMGIDL